MNNTQNPYRICFKLNMASILLASIPSVLGILYVIFWLVLGIFTFFWVWMELDMDFYTNVAKLSFLVIPFAITPLILNIISNKLPKYNFDNKLTLITSLFILLLEILCVAGLIIIGKQLCSKLGNGSMVFFLTSLLAAIICTVISIIKYNSIKKQNGLV